MTGAPIPALVCTLAVPTIISMLITSFYNMADTFFVGRLSTSAVAAVGVVFPLMAVIQAVGFMFGHGSGNYISRKLGSKDTENASRMASTGFFSAFIAGIVIMAAGLVFLGPLVRVLGATDTIAPYARSYARWILLGAPYMTASLVLNNQLRFQGSAFYAMIGIASGAILNIALDPLFIFVLGMGVGGAALATIISQFVSFCLLLYGYTRGGSVRLSLRDFKPEFSLYREIVRGGFPSLCRQGLASVAGICLNVAAAPFGDAAVAAMSIVNRVTGFASSALIGFGQGFQPVCGFNYGAKLYDRVRRAFWFCVRLSSAALVVGAAAGYVFAPQIISLFRAEDADVISVGAQTLRFQCFSFPLTGWITLCNMILQPNGKAAKASVLAMARQGLFFLPVLLVLSLTMGLRGVELSQAAADAFTFLLALPLGIGVLREMKEAALRPGKNAA